MCSFIWSLDNVKWVVCHDGAVTQWHNPLTWIRQIDEEMFDLEKINRIIKLENGKEYEIVFKRSSISLLEGKTKLNRVELFLRLYQQIVSEIHTTYDKKLDYLYHYINKWLKKIIVIYVVY